ncbi:MAG TPA: hypothetical protein VGF77_05665 [Allosphingosinicella sp.]|jgi:hypothetical protein
MQRYDPNAAHGAVFSLCPGTEYATIAAAQTDQVLAGSESGDGVGAVGDYLSHLVIVPAAAACGAVSVKDGSNAITIFAGGGTVALPTLAPITIFLGLRSKSGSWKVTTGASVSVIAAGAFS